MKGNMEKIGCLFLLLSAMPLFAHAQTIANSPNGNTQLSLKTGMMDGKSGEYVYDADGSGSGIKGYKVSELQWSLNNVWMAGLELRHRFSNRFAIGLDYWVNAGKGDGYMVDYDWLYIGLDWSHRSQHPDTTVHKVNRFDINGDFTLKNFYDDATSLYALLGYRQDHFDWQARGGTAIYSDMVSLGYRDMYLVFADVPAISYKQTYQTPYLGIGVRSSGPVGGKMVHVNLRSRYSQWVKGEGDDIHHMRDLRFVDTGEDGRWLDIALDAHVELSKRLDLHMGISHTAYSEIKGPTVITDLTDGSKTHYPGDAGGLDHRSSLLSLGLNYRF